MRKRIPRAVWLAVLALGVVSSVQGALAALLVRGGQVGWGHFAFAAATAVLLLNGLLRGSRLAWMWGRWLALLLSALVAARAAVALARGEATPWLGAAVLGGIALLLVGAAVALTRASAMSFYGLVCPECATPTRRSADFLFRHARCGRCGNVW